MTKAHVSLLIVALLACATIGVALFEPSSPALTPEGDGTAADTADRKGPASKDGSQPDTAYRTGPRSSDGSQVDTTDRTGPVSRDGSQVDTTYRTGPSSRDGSQVDTTYRTGPVSRDGLGKFYMNREISQVMGHLGAAWLERPAREREERTDLLIRSLPLEDDDVVADIGAGTGYFSFPIAERVPDGRVIAVDIQREMLDIIEARIADGAPANVETLLGAVDDPRLDANSVDLILIVDAYHEFSHPREMGLAMAEALKPGGRLVLIEYRAEDPTVPIKRLHKMSEAQAKAEMAAVGLEWVRTESMLPQQHFLVFRKPEF